MKNSKSMTKHHLCCVAQNHCKKTKAKRNKNTRDNEWWLKGIFLFSKDQEKHAMSIFFLQNKLNSEPAVIGIG